MGAVALSVSRPCIEAGVIGAGAIGVPIADILVDKIIKEDLPIAVEAIEHGRGRVDEVINQGMAIAGEARGSDIRSRGYQPRRGHHFRHF